MSALPTICRPMAEPDRHFILSTWLKACRYSLSSKRVPNDHYYKYQQKLIERLWARNTVKTTILALAEDEAVILGYLCSEILTEFPVIHFAYVKATFQGNGFFKLLLKDARIDLEKEIVFTHYTLESLFLKEKRERDQTEQYVTAEVLKHKYPKTVYNPYLAITGEE